MSDEPRRTHLEMLIFGQSHSLLPPSIPQPQDSPLSREPEYIPGQPVLLANLEEGWVTRTSEHDFDPEVEAALIPRSPVKRGQLQRMRMQDAALHEDVSPRLATTLEEAWDDGYWAGEAYIAACCGCSGMGERPQNPHSPDAHRVEVRAWGEHDAVRVYRGL